MSGHSRRRRLPQKTPRLNIMVMPKTCFRVMLMYCLSRLSPNRFALLAAFLGVLFGFALNSEEKAALGNFIVSIGQAMLTAQAQQEYQESVGEREDLGREIRELDARMEEIKRKLRL
jgi:hypothetical protein